MNAKEMIKECESRGICDRCKAKRECGEFSEMIRRTVKPKDWNSLIGKLREMK